VAWCQFDNLKISAISEGDPSNGGTLVKKSWTNSGKPAPSKGGK
jgi:hypothetical protein